MLFVCCFTIHDMICATLYVHCSVLLQIRHSGFETCEHTQGFGIEPYLYTVHGVVAIAWYDSNAGYRSCST